ncbi:T9SS type A sorting domain-containing protein [Salibacteraceae bacterium]|jgi:hypothetical protein|nr:T9SS type A sorting domain-containing protein [Salibacteraceae bacterium]
MKSIYFTLAFSFLAFGAWSQTAYVNGTPISVVNSSSVNLTDSVNLGSYTPTIAATADAKKIYTATFDNTYIIDIATNTIEDSIVGFTPKYKAGTNANEIYGVRNTSFYTVNTTDNSIDSITLPNTDRLEFRPGANEMWVTSDSVIHIVDLESGASLSSTIITGSIQWDGSDLRFSQDGSLAIKLNWSSKTLAKIDAVNKTVTTMMDFGFSDNVSGVEVMADGSAAFVSASNDNIVYKVDVNSMTTTDSIILPRSPFGMYRHPVDGKIWIVGHFDDIIYIMNPDDMSIEDSVEVGSSPHIVAFVKSPLGSPALGSNNSISVFPNPASNVVVVSLLEQNSTWELLDLRGTKVKTGFSTTSSFQINLEGMSSGVYFLNSGDQVQKIVVQ